GQETEQLTSPPSSTESREPERAQDFQPPQIEHPLPAGLPPDITAEELAAIQAAAATVAQAAEESSAAKPDAGIVEPTEENAAETTPASFASAPQTAVMLQDFPPRRPWPAMPTTKMLADPLACKRRASQPIRRTQRKEQKFLRRNHLHPMRT